MAGKQQLHLLPIPSYLVSPHLSHPSKKKITSTLKISKYSDWASGPQILAALSTSLSIDCSGSRGRKLCERILWCHNFWVSLEHLIIIPLAIPAFSGRSVEAIDLFTSTGIRLGLFWFSVNYAFSVWDPTKEVSSERGRFFSWAGAWAELSRDVTNQATWKMPWKSWPDNNWCSHHCLCNNAKATYTKQQGNAS